MKTHREKPVHVTRRFETTPQTLFDAWVHPAIMKKWMFKSPTNEIINIKLDLKNGGKFSILELANDKTINHYGEYLEIERPHRLKFTLEVPEHFPGVTEVTVSIGPTSKGCELELVQTGVAPEVTEKNWEDMLKKLEEVTLRGMDKR
jgi:uncharacterized protein YndB with AHSA1/START domain